ncbi:substrate-binding domain-containing protein [Vibrio sp. ZSDZ34]|uniref:Substrate-binding domain-containing protein n=1 Tax=Vibrio gelatinilyticus TaxID=2893468 RepID=A0A9X1WEE9_9VIBR|nr:substrate-binding domain-containing protein [Vibrio gelatinilyticus]MCJ2376800.1 substrate-binding domain-containing protein [Vibrio gelatinilyticus]
MNKKKKSATVYDVAKLAGVSPSTVSRFLNRTTFVSNSKSKSIESAIKTTGYKPNFQMQQGDNRRSMTIGVLVQHPDSPYTSTILNDMEKTLMAKGYSLVMASGHWQSKLEMHALEYLLKSKVDGIIIITGNLDIELIRNAAKSVPIVTVGCYDIQDENICSLQLDNVMGGYIATLHLLQQGHKNIAHIKGLSTQPDAGSRYEGYKKALLEANIKVNRKLIKQGDFGMEKGYQQTIELIDSNIYFSAIFAANDLTAYGAIKALHDRGLRVPEDVSVVGFDDIATSLYFTPALTTLRQPIGEIGTVCANSILNLVVKGDYEARMPPIDLVIRQSTSSIYGKDH